MQDGLRKARETIVSLINENKRLCEEVSALRQDVSSRDEEISRLKVSLLEARKYSNFETCSEISTRLPTNDRVDVTINLHNSASSSKPIERQPRKKKALNETKQTAANISVNNHAIASSNVQPVTVSRLSSLGDYSNRDSWLKFVIGEPNNLAAALKSNDLTENPDILLNNMAFLSSFSIVPREILWNSFCNDTNQMPGDSSIRHDFSLSWIILCTILMQCTSPDDVVVHRRVEYSSKIDLTNQSFEFFAFHQPVNHLVNFIKSIGSVYDNSDILDAYVDWQLKFALIWLAETITEKYLDETDCVVKRDISDSSHDEDNLIDEAFSSIWKSRSIEISGKWTEIDDLCLKVSFICKLMCCLYSNDKDECLFRLSNVLCSMAESVFCVIGCIDVNDNHKLCSLDIIRQSVICHLFCICYTSAIDDNSFVDSSLSSLGFFQSDWCLSSNVNHHLFASLCALETYRACYSDAVIDRQHQLHIYLQAILINQTINDSTLSWIYFLGFMHGPTAIYSELEAFITESELSSTLFNINLIRVTNQLLKAMRTCCIVSNYICWPSSINVIDQESDLYNVSVRCKFVDLEWQLVHENIIARLSTTAQTCFDRLHGADLDCNFDIVLTYCDLLIENLFGSRQRLVIAIHYLKKIASRASNMQSNELRDKFQRLSDVASKLQHLPVGIVINLASRPDRWIRLLNRCSRDQTILLTRIDAVSVQPSLDEVSMIWNSALNNKFDHNCAVKDDTVMTPTERSCAGSHLRLWSMIANESMPIVVDSPAVVCLNDVDFSKTRHKHGRDVSSSSCFDYVLVFEDDAEFSLSWNPKKKKLCTNYITACSTHDIPLPLTNQISKYRFIQQLNICMQEAPENADFIFLGYIMSSFARSKLFSTHLLIPEYLWQLHCYVVSKNACQMICDLSPIIGPVDNFISSFSYDGGLAIVCPLQPLAYQPTRRVLAKRRVGYSSDIVHSGSDWERYDEVTHQDSEEEKEIK